jgi:hypothetical protein
LQLERERNSSLWHLFAMSLTVSSRTFWRVIGGIHNVGLHVMNLPGMKASLNFAIHPFPNWQNMWQSPLKGKITNLNVKIYSFK